MFSPGRKVLLIMETEFAEANRHPLQKLLDPNAAQHGLLGRRHNPFPLVFPFPLGSIPGRRVVLLQAQAQKICPF